MIRLLAQTGVLLVLLVAQTASAADFCWKVTTGRGVGSLPPSRVADCPATYTNDGAFCGRGAKTYHAPSRVADCPKGWTNMGAYCGRGVHTKGMSAMSCPSGYFRKAARCYEVCREGYTNNGDYCGMGASTKGRDAMTCRPDEILVPIEGFPRCFPVSGCGPGKESSGGLCYAACPANSNGIGPVCWGQPPQGWVNCAMGAAKDHATCGSVIFGQVSSVAMDAAQIGAAVFTAGASAGAEGAAKATADTGKLAQLKAKLEELKAAYAKIKPLVKGAGAMYADIKLANEDNPTPEDIAHVIAQIAAIGDPTGIADTVAAYTYPKCDEIR